MSLTLNALKRDSDFVLGANSNNNDKPFWADHYTAEEYRVKRNVDRNSDNDLYESDLSVLSLG